MLRVFDGRFLVEQNQNCATFSISQHLWHLRFGVCCIMLELCGDSIITPSSCNFYISCQPTSNEKHTVQKLVTCGQFSVGILFILLVHIVGNAAVDGGH